MALTSSSALKATIEGFGLGVSVYHDLVPSSATRPYVVVYNLLAVQPETLHGPDSAHVGVELAQVDLVYNYRDPNTGTKQENAAAEATLIRSLQGAKVAPFGSPALNVYACLVRDVKRIVEEAPSDTAKVAVTVHLWREL